MIHIWGAAQSPRPRDEDDDHDEGRPLFVAVLLGVKYWARCPCTLSLVLTATMETGAP